MKTENSKKWTRMFAVVMTLALVFGGAVSAYALPGVNLPESNVAQNDVPVADNGVPGVNPPESNVAQNDVPVADNGVPGVNPPESNVAQNDVPVADNGVPGVNPPESNVAQNDAPGANDDVPSETEDTGITPYDVILVNESVQSTSYEKTFSTHPDHGTRLNVYVENNSTFSVEMVVTNNDTGVSRTYNLAAGTNRTSSWTNPDGIRNSYTIQVNNTIGAEMDLYIRARQY